MYRASIADQRHVFEDLVALLAKASPLRSGDVLAGVAAGSEEERVAAQSALADLPLRMPTGSLAPRWGRYQLTRAPA